MFHLCRTYQAEDAFVGKYLLSSHTHDQSQQQRDGAAPGNNEGYVSYAITSGFVQLQSTLRKK